MLHLNFSCSAERQRGRIQNNLSFSTPVNGNAMDYSRLSMNGDDILSNRLRVELDRSIAKHLEAGKKESSLVENDYTGPLLLNYCSY